MTSFALAKKNMISTKGLTISQLLRSTDTLRKSGSGDTIIKALSFTRTGNGMLVAKAKMLSAKGPPVVYDTWITFMELKDRSRITPTAKVMAQCSCADYMYRWEYANAAHNAARIFYGNGEPPDEQNPAQKPGLCKHAYCLAKKLIETY